MKDNSETVHWSRIQDKMTFLNVCFTLLHKKKIFINGLNKNV